MHILPQLRKLEEKHQDTLAVVGVHSAKFDTERATENVRAAVRRYDIRHPVVNDADFAVWNLYGARAWPTLVFIDPNGTVIGKHEGEFELTALDNLLNRMIAEFDAEGSLSREPLPFLNSSTDDSEGVLSFPGKVLAASDAQLYIADSGHHQVVVAAADGTVKDVIGNGESPLANEVSTSTIKDKYGISDRVISDQSFDSALLDNPQGMALDGTALYIADAGMHVILRADLETRCASVIAGTGEQSLFRHAGGAAKTRPLNSPYALSYADGILYIAMAGAHQLWSLDVDAGAIAPFAGAGAENIVDGLRDEALLAQPCGLSLKGNNLFFADAETSAIRVAKIGTDGRVVTLTGTGLFDFGDRDGIGKEARLQHAQDVAAADAVYIADTYNHKIKQIELSTLRVTTIAGTGKVGRADGAALESTFNEPAGISYCDGMLYITDTNNHLLRRLNLNERRVETVELRGI